MQFDGQTLLMAGGMVIGALVWLVRLEGRINIQTELYRQLRDDVTYIRARIDEALNSKP